jgi:hypothetical protein
MLRAGSEHRNAACPRIAAWTVSRSWTLRIGPHEKK